MVVIILIFVFLRILVGLIMLLVDLLYVMCRRICDILDLFVFLVLLKIFVFIVFRVFFEKVVL